MTTESQKSFADRFFAVTRRTRTFVLGERNEICGHSHALALDGMDSCRLLEAAGIENHHGRWGIGVFIEPLAVCGRLYPKHTLVVFQGSKPGSRFTLFSVHENDVDLYADLCDASPVGKNVQSGERAGTETCDDGGPCYDFGLTGDLNEKLKTAIGLLDEVEVLLRAQNEDYLEPFLHELRQGAGRIVEAIRGLDQEPIV